jgi:SSS family solute:Na+ symporter
MDRWAPYLYIYGVGGAVFGAGLAVAWRRGALAGDRAGRRLLGLLVLGLILYASGHAIFQAAGAPGPLPQTGSARGVEGFVGSPIDLVVVAVYFMVILGMGAFFARFTRTSSDFFFGGRRFSGWLVATSCVATTVGAYSFIKYGSAGFRYGLSSTMSYLNDWFWMPLWMLVWLPIIYYGRIQSVPEYFQRRFGSPARNAATIILLLYLVGYVGINFLTLGKALHALTGWTVFQGAVLAALATGIYVAVGGQTSVIMTDLAQGLLLLVVGVGLFVAGALHVGGFVDFWNLLPGQHRMALGPLTEPDSFPAMGIFWQDAMAGGIAFYFWNQGILMRFMSARSVREGRKAMAAVVLVVMPLAAIAVSGAGWIARAMVATGELPADVHPDNAFVLAARILSSPGIFGLVMATLTAALMSTADTLLTAVAAVFVNDIWRPYLRPWLLPAASGDRPDLAAARVATVVTAAVALALVPIGNSFSSVYQAHATFVAVITPPLGVALILGAAWPRFGSRAAMLTLVGGSVAMIASLIWPELIAAFAQGVEAGGEGIKAHKYMRACFGLAVSGALGVAGVLLYGRSDGPPDPVLVAGPEARAERAFKGAEPKVAGARVDLRVEAADVPVETWENTDEVLVALHPEDAERLGAAAGDLIHVGRPGAWHGGLFSFHARVAAEAAPAEDAGRLRVPRALLRPSGLADGGSVRVELQG